MTNLGEMLDDIADELARSDLETQTRRCIKRAIQHYQRKHFYFLEDYSVTFNTVASQEYYGSSDNAAIPNYSEIDSLVITINGDRISLDKKPKEWFDTISNSASQTGQPSDYIYYAQQFRLYPIPDAAYEIRIHGLKRLDDITQTASSNVMFTEGFDLIKYSAKRRLCTDYLKNDEDATRAGLGEKLALDGIASETVIRAATSFKPTQF
jgi:hypothetical protein